MAQYDQDEAEMDKLKKEMDAMMDGKALQAMREQFTQVYQQVIST
jgi:hypothetical protein